MARLPLLGGAYSARSIIANCQRCINLFPETNPKDSPVPLTHYQRPGLRALVQGDNAPVRGVFRASNGNGYCVIGQKVYSVSNTWVLTQIGAIAGGGANPVSQVDNGATAMLVDGSPQGYTIDLGTNAFGIISDPSFTGATRVDYLDTFMVWNVPGTRLFRSTLSNTVAFDPLYEAAKTTFADPLSTLIVNRREIQLLGQVKSELWYDDGGAQFPFSRLPGAYIEHGTISPYSVAASDISVFWLGYDQQGQGLVFRQRGYETTLISNYAITYAIRKMAAGGMITDAIGYVYQQDGHVFYVLSFPTGNQTWVFDDSIGDAQAGWHQRCWDNGDGSLNRDRTNCHAVLYGKNVVGDWENGTLYSLDLDLYVDQVSGRDDPISCIRTFPHITTGFLPDGTPVPADGKRVQFSSFLADIESGEADQGLLNPPRVSLRWSDTRGKSWGNALLQSNGNPGEYLTQPKWAGLGIARDRVFELAYSIAGPAALNGAWVDAKVLES